MFAGKTEAEIKEEEDLQLALAISKSEALEKEKQKLRNTSELLAGFGQNKKQETLTPEPEVNQKLEETEPELSRWAILYFNQSH